MIWKFCHALARAVGDLEAPVFSQMEPTVIRVNRLEVGVYK